MGKLKKSINNTSDQESGLDWEQLLVGYQNQTVDEVLTNLMNKVKKFEIITLQKLKIYLILT